MSAATAIGRSALANCSFRVGVYFDHLCTAEQEHLAYPDWLVAYGRRIVVADAPTPFLSPIALIHHLFLLVDRSILVSDIRNLGICVWQGFLDSPNYCDR